MLKCAAHLQHGAALLLERACRPQAHAPNKCALVARHYYVEHRPPLWASSAALQRGRQLAQAKLRLLSNQNARQAVTVA